MLYGVDKKQQIQSGSYTCTSAPCTAQFRSSIQHCRCTLPLWECNCISSMTISKQWPFDSESATDLFRNDALTRTAKARVMTASLRPTLILLCIGRIMYSHAVPCSHMIPWINSTPPLSKKSCCASRKLRTRRKHPSVCFSSVPLCCRFKISWC